MMEELGHLMTKRSLCIGVGALTVLFLLFAATLSRQIVGWIKDHLSRPLPVHAEPIESDGTYTNVIFLHHSVGRNVIEQGNVRSLFTQEGYHFWDHDYNTIGLTRPDGTRTHTSYGIPGGDGGGNTDPGGLAALFAQPVHDPPDNAFSRLMQHEVLIFKSCFPNSAITSEERLEQHKHWYLQIRKVIDQHPDKVFVFLTSPPLHPAATTQEEAARARRLANWLASDTFLAGHTNLFVFDFFDLLADSDTNMLRREYQRSSDEADSHPNARANQTIGPLLVDFVDEAVQVYRSDH
jgi:hypothetical protein